MDETRRLVEALEQSTDLLKDLLADEHVATDSEMARISVRIVYNEEAIAAVVTTSAYNGAAP